LEHLRTTHQKLLDTIKTTGELKKETDDELKGIVESFINGGGFAQKWWTLIILFRTSMIDLINI